MKPHLHDFDLDFDHAGYTKHRIEPRPEGGWLVGYLTPDPEPHCILEGDGLGKIISSHRRDGDRRAYYRALGLDEDGNVPEEFRDGREYPAIARLEKQIEKILHANPKQLNETWSDYCKRSDVLTREQTAAVAAITTRLWERAKKKGDVGERWVVALDVYAHGGEHWSVAGTRAYPDERWDVSRGGGVWVPDKCLTEELERIAKRSYAKAQAKAAEYAAQYCEMYNAVNDGSVYGVVLAEYDAELGKITSDECWGYYPSEYAEKELDSWVEARLKELA